MEASDCATCLIEIVLFHARDRATERIRKGGKRSYFQGVYCYTPKEQEGSLEGLYVLGQKVTC